MASKPAIVRHAVLAPKLAKPLFDHPRIGQNPTIGGAMIDLETTFPEHFLMVSALERIAQMAMVNAALTG
jgi:hypothetical protein